MGQSLFAPIVAGSSLTPLGIGTSLISAVAPLLSSPPEPPAPIPAPAAAPLPDAPPVPLDTNKINPAEQLAQQAAKTRDLKRRAADQTSGITLLNSDTSSTSNGKTLLGQ